MKNEEDEDKSERYEFIHLSFGEFLAAASLFELLAPSNSSKLSEKLISVESFLA